MTKWPDALQKLLLSCLLIFLIGCSSTPMQYRYLDSQTLSDVELTNTPFYPQDEFQCGPAALATVLNVAGVDDATPETLKPQVYLPEREGSLQSELLGAARRAERIPYVIRPQLADLFKEVEAGNPVLVLQNLGFARWPIWHYAVVIGYNPRRNEVILRSGTTERETMSLRAFEHSWRGGNYWAMVVPALGELPATAEPIRYFAAIAAQEQQGRFELAEASYRLAMERWPSEYMAPFGLGNIAFQQGRFSEAEFYYYKASEIAAEEPAIFFNLAWALVRQNRGEEALLAAEIAQMLAPEHARYGASVEIISNAVNQTTRSH
ncbi:PA2778 family cysteine peptidase [Aliidiomarina sanyensis]|uniref:Peptidase C39-like domain-containing protein n=1 Tax=Aliidiomarina sanyensis TaxID=1249555 RepID=A0A432WSB1_9GAMM|nr:PA2778 family cysteine peptidase [Aliidiomarina sanyensis]RUO36652.1 hypothetical protein CWE11_02240 [Aliidiomarina sanyensis]